MSATTEPVALEAPTMDELAGLDRYFRNRGLPALGDPEPAHRIAWRTYNFAVTGAAVAAVAIAFLAGLSGWLLIAYSAGTLFVWLAASTRERLNARHGEQRPWVARVAGFSYIDEIALTLVGGAASLVLHDPRPLGYVAVPAAVSAVAWLGLTSGAFMILPHAIWSAVKCTPQSILIGLTEMPLLLPFVVVIFLSSEAWQFFGGLEGERFLGLIALFAAMAGALLFGEGKKVADSLAPRTFEDLRKNVHDTPAQDLARRVELPARYPRLEGHQRWNVRLALLTTLYARVVVLGGAMFLFVVVLGLIGVPADVEERWTTVAPDEAASVDVGGHEIVVSWALVHIATLLAGFSTLYFAVELKVRARVADLVSPEVRRLKKALAAWVVYQAAR